MNVLGDFIRQQMTVRGWVDRRGQVRQIELVRRSGLTKQVVSRLLDPNIELRRMIDDKTVRGLARAFQLPEQLIRAKSAEAIGAIEPQPTPTQPELSNDELLQILAKKLGIDVSTDPAAGTSGLVQHSSDPASSPNTETTADSVAGVSGGGVSGETVTPGELRHPRRRSRGSDSTDDGQPIRASAHA